VVASPTEHRSTDPAIRGLTTGGRRSVAISAEAFACCDCPRSGQAGRFLTLYRARIRRPSDARPTPDEGGGLDRAELRGGLTAMSRSMAREFAAAGGRRTRILRRQASASGRPGGTSTSDKASAEWRREFRRMPLSSRSLSYAYPGSTAGGGNAGRCRSCRQFAVVLGHCVLLRRHFRRRDSSMTPSNPSAVVLRR